MDKLLAFLNSKNGRFLLIGGSIIFIIAVLIVSVLPSGSGSNDPDPILPGTVDQPFSYDGDKRIELSEELFTEDLTKDKPLYIYEIIERNKLDTARSFIRAAGKQLLGEEDYEVVYYWRNNNNLASNEVIEYNVVRDYILFNFDSAVDLNLTVPAALSENNAGELLQQFTGEYISSDFDYEIYSVSREGLDYRIEANRIIGNYPLQVAGDKAYSDYLLVDDKGRVIEGKFHLFEYDVASGVEVELIDTLTLGAAISRDDYPKEFYQDVPENFDYALFAGQPALDDDGSFYGDAPAFTTEFPEMTSCEATDISVVYYFFSTGFDKLTPVYRIDCVGEIIFEGQSFVTKAAVYVNAIDPELVFVPSEVVDN